MGVVSYPAPVGGWNARDDLASMPPTDAVILENWRPRPGYLQVRRGQTQVLAETASINGRGTFITFSSQAGEIVIFSSNDYLYWWDGETSSSTLLYTGDSADPVGGTTYWDFAHFQNRFIMTLGDGSNPAQVITYNGTTASTTALNITTGPNEEDIKGVQVHKGRAYYWEPDSQSFWYAAAGAFQGDLTEFDLATALKFGGTLQMMVTLTLDGGGGQDDLAAFIFSSGEVLVYQGDDPGDAAAWELVGAFQIGPPVNPQAHCKIAGTELILTQDGIIDLIAALKLGRFGESAEFSNKITRAVTEGTTQFGANEGWQLIHAPGDNCVLLNVPYGLDGDGVNRFAQYVRETDTGSWWFCRGWRGSMTVFKGKLHMIDNNDTGYTINRCFDGDTDAIEGSTSVPIRSQAVPAFTAMRKPAKRKVLTTVKPFTNITDPSNIYVTGLSDFNVEIPFSGSRGNEIPTTVTESGTQTQPNISAFANGHFITFDMKIETSSANVVIWNATTLIYSDGGPL